MAGLRLSAPSLRFQRSWLAAADEFIAADEQHYAGLFSWAGDASCPSVDFTRHGLGDPEVFAELVALLLDQRRPEAKRPRAYVPFTEFWITEGEEYLGRISVRHELNELLYNWGGHIGYVVRPSARRQGLASWALQEVLEHCRTLDIDPVLVTCDPDNEGSRRTIESAGGIYEDTREHKLRYWIDLS